MIDPVAAERAEKELDKFINSRAKRKGADEANAVEAIWRASERAHAEKQREENRALWLAYFSHLDHGCRVRAAEYEARAAKLLEETGEGVAS